MSIDTMFPNFVEFEKEAGDGVTIHGKRKGSGPPLLLLHGYVQQLKRIQTMLIDT